MGHLTGGHVQEPMIQAHAAFASLGHTGRAQVGSVSVLWPAEFAQ